MRDALDGLPDQKFVREVLSNIAAQGLMARAAGGIGLDEVMCGRDVPPGYRLDPYSLSYIPAGINLDGGGNA